jgi:murein DD-endopeptidase MepM/ murein hydrolase activator NlpD
LKILLIREHGALHSVRINVAAAVAVGVLALCCVAGVLGAVAFAPSATGGGGVSDPSGELAAKIEAQRAELARLTAMADAQSQTLAQTVGRQLAQMQARLVRMEALGERVAEVADLDPSEFRFSEPAPQGGPVASREYALPWPDVETGLDRLAAELRFAENRLEVMESLLHDRDYRQAKALRGRPVKWGWISSPYGERIDPISGQQGWHAGVDFAGKAGSDVIAVASGVVVYAGDRYGFGKMVEISHGDGYVTRYAHHEDVVVAPGDIVKKGQVIGTMGSSGRSTGPHVHFEVLKNGRHVDPAKYVASRS